MHDIRNYAPYGYWRGGAHVPSSWFRCKFGTPLRKMVALVRLLENEGYRILGTENFIVAADGIGIVKKGKHPRVMAKELYRMMMQHD